MARQSVRLELKDGGEVEVASVAVAEKHYPDAKVLHVTTFDKDGNATTESHRDWKKRRNDEAAEREARATEREKEERRAARAAEREAAATAPTVSPAVNAPVVATTEAKR